MSNYKKFTDTELYELMNEPWEVADRPYLLHAAYALSCLYETLVPDNDDEIENFSIWGQKIPEKVLKSIVKNVAENFIGAARNGGRIDINGKGYSIRKVNAFNPAILTEIFDFPLENGEYTIVKEGVRSLATVECMSYQDDKEQFTKNRWFLRAVILIAEDDKNNGWDKLTDMEIAVYCWAQFYHKYGNNNETQFISEYKDYLYVGKRDMIGCWTDYAEKAERPNGLYTFDYLKVMQWNKGSNQKSIVDRISEQEAEDYWYDTALKTTFKPAQ